MAIFREISPTERLDESFHSNFATRRGASITPSCHSHTTGVQRWRAAYNAGGFRDVDLSLNCELDGMRVRKGTVIELGMAAPAPVRAVEALEDEGQHKARGSGTL